MPSRRRAAPPPPVPTSLERQTVWAGVQAGDAVDVLDPREKGATWRFEAHVANATTGEEWVEVVGGRRGDARRRSFRVEQIFASGALRTGPSPAPLVDAPRLPLGDAPTAPRRGGRG